MESTLTAITTGQWKRNNNFNIIIITSDHTNKFHAYNVNYTVSGKYGSQEPPVYSTIVIDVDNSSGRVIDVDNSSGRIIDVDIYSVTRTHQEMR